MTQFDEKIREGRDALSLLPRVRLAALPTPLDDCPRLSARLGGPMIMVKRDDCTGLAFGGNKVRQHEYVLGSAIANGADCLVQGSASQSNHSRQLAAAGAKLGLETFLLPKQDALSSPIQGNYLVDHILGATIMPIAPEQSTIEAKAALVERLRAEGRNPYVTGMGADDALTYAAVAYVEALFEIIEQLPAGRSLDWIYTASQGSTHAGLLIACELLGLPTRIVGVNPTSDTHEAYIAPEGVLELVHGAAALLGFTSSVTLEDIDATGEFVGPGYGIPSPAGLEAIRVLGSTEGILLDPVYTGKAFSALLAHCREGRFRADETVVFLHTGGLPAIFAYNEVLAEAYGDHPDAHDPVHQYTSK
ncbi:MAG: 1-aminocyclopropane-carboxylate deaminase [Rhodoglobus sp.]|nr:1-aminocyclopropane-carboxylate deaminase [Rhodoglobus sp.]